ncbi:MAG: phosphosulfolactate synthase [Halanaerobiaceae bacterium]
MRKNVENPWNIGLENPLKGRVEKPRNKGLTMIIDKGLGLSNIRDLLEVGHLYIDFIKFSFGTSLIYPSDVLREKIKLIKDYNIDVYPGGTLFEIAVTQNKVFEFFARAKQLGFTAIEVSDGTIDLSRSFRKEVIFEAKKMGFRVLSEVGKKDSENPLSLQEMQKQIKDDLLAGVDNIIIEGRESGKAISIYDESGEIDMEMLRGILRVVNNSSDVLIWEAPLKKQQVLLIEELGSNVSLGNIQPGEIFALESLRRGLRGDTLKLSLEKNNYKSLNVESRG